MITRVSKSYTDIFTIKTTFVFQMFIHKISLLLNITLLFNSFFLFSFRTNHYGKK